ncbi:MAG: hypothetical protein GC201_14285 [Alphaproteobacteria bacterium]|nr:hypothetical protein [Alphaproteobacteria bacterium]
MKKIYVPSRGVEDWKRLLANPCKQWRSRYSAKAMAHSWEAADGLPPEVAAIFEGTCELLLAVPEHKVRLPGGARESQNDIFALLRVGERTCAATIEGKVNEAFGPAIGDWLRDASEGKQERLRFMSDLLGIALPADSLRYQLLHRAASALIEAERFKTDFAAMIVHSFSPEKRWFDDFARFVSLFGPSAEPGRGYAVSLPSGRTLILGWAVGEARFLEA